MEQKIDVLGKPALQNRFKVVFDKSELLTRELTYFKYDTGYREYVAEFRIPEKEYEQLLENANSIRRFVLTVLDTNGETIFERNFVSNRIVGCSNEFDYSKNDPVVLRVKGNF